MMANLFLYLTGKNRRFYKTAISGVALQTPSPDVFEAPAHGGASR
jgi:hypothetical protein